MQNRVLILEPSVRGHRGAYLGWMVSGLVQRRIAVTLVTTNESLLHPSLDGLRRYQVGEGGGDLKIIAGPSEAPNIREAGTWRLVWREVLYWKMLKQWFEVSSRESVPHAVLIPGLDFCLNALAILGSPFGAVPWVGIAMRPSFHYEDMSVVAPRPKLSRIKRSLFIRLLHSRFLKQLLIIDEALLEFLKLRGETRNVVSLLPHPVETGDCDESSGAVAMLVQTEALRKTILVYGALSRRKGIGELLRAVSSEGFPSGVDVLLVGEADAHVREMLAAPWVTRLFEMGRVMMHDRYVDEAEERSLFAAADAVWLGYRGHYTASGVLAIAAAHNVPVIATHEGLIGWQTKRYGLGRIVDPGSRTEIIAAVRSLLSDENSLQQVETVDLRGLRTTYPEAQDIVAKALL